MPYVKPELRKLVDKEIDTIIDVIDEYGETTTGMLNYIITRLVHRFILNSGMKVGYDFLNSMYGVMCAATAEFYRRVVAPYEDKKRMENGPVSDLDAKSLEDVR